ncbi:MAG: hypothetical protein ACI898_002199, partial [Flavobacteriales bacterium]
HFLFTLFQTSWTGVTANNGISAILDLSLRHENDIGWTLRF